MTRSSSPAADSRLGIQVIARATGILRLLQQAEPLSLGQIALQTGLPRSTVQRIVAALATERLVTAGSGGVRLGPGLRALAGAARQDMRDLCRPLLTDLARQTGETVDLSVLRGGQMIFLDQVEGSGRLRTVSAVGEAFPLTTTANGRACLAALADQQMLHLATSEWARREVSVDVPAFLGLIARVRDRGLAYDLGDHTPGISAIGLSFADAAGEVHAISVPIPSSRYAEKRHVVEAALEALRPALATLATP